MFRTICCATIIAQVLVRNVCAEFARLWRVSLETVQDPRPAGAARHRPPGPRADPPRAQRGRAPRAPPTSPADLDIPANQASFHLRQLAKYGLVVEAPEEARDRRDRVWKVVSESGIQLDLAEMDKEPGGPAAVDVWSENSRRFSHAVVDAIYASAATRRTRSATSSQGALRLTDEEAKELAAELRRGRPTVERADPWTRSGAQDLHDHGDPAALPRPGTPPRSDRRVIRWGRARPTPPSSPADVRDALAAEPRGPEQTRLLVKHFLAVLSERAPGASVEVRVPPYAAVQAVAGVRHTRGTPPAVVELDADTWIALATGELAWAEAESRGPGARQRRASRPVAPAAPGGRRDRRRRSRRRSSPTRSGRSTGVELVVWPRRRACRARDRGRPGRARLRPRPSGAGEARRGAAAARRTAADGGVRRRPRADARPASCSPARAAYTTTRPRSWRWGSRSRRCGASTSPSVRPGTWRQDTPASQPGRQQGRDPGLRLDRPRGRRADAGLPGASSPGSRPPRATTTWSAGW